MFEIDLLTKTGLQKALQKTNFDKNKKKQNIIFNISEDEDVGDMGSSSKSRESFNFSSILIFGALATILIFFGLFNVSNSIKINNFLPKSYASKNANEYENVLTTVIKVLGSRDSSISLNQLELYDNLLIIINVDSIDKIKYLDAHSLFSYKIYKSDNGYKVQLYYPINDWTNDSFDSELTLTNLVKYYNNDHNVKMQMDNQSIYFSTNDKGIIIRIFETLMFSGNISIYPDDSTNIYNLVYSY